MWRRFVAVVIGFITIGVLSQGADYLARYIVPWAFDVRGRVEDPRVLMCTVGYVFVFGVLGCYLSALIARKRPMFHALVLGVLGLVLNLVGVVSLWQTAPAWYWVCSLALVMPAAFIGGALRIYQIGRPSRQGTPTNTETV